MQKQVEEWRAEVSEPEAYDSVRCGALLRVVLCTSGFSLRWIGMFSLIWHTDERDTNLNSCNESSLKLKDTSLRTYKL